MIIKNILEELNSAKHPIARALHKTKDSKTICIALKAGMSLKEHKAHQSTRLMVIEGRVRYLEQGATYLLSKYDDYEIPVEVPHSLDAETDSIIFLLQRN